MKNEYLQAAGKPGILIEKDVKEAFRAGLVLLDAASANIAEAGRLFASIDAAVWATLLEDAPAPMRRTLEHVREVGEGKIIPQLATASGEASVRLRGMSLADQHRLWSSPVEMFAPGRVGKHAKYMRFVTDMTGEEIKRAFEHEGKRNWRLRTYDEQKAWEAEQAAFTKPEKPSGVDRPGRWAVRGGKVYISMAKAASGLSKREVQTILKDMEEES